MNEYSNDVRNILREDLEWTIDKFVRLTSHLDHLTKLGRKSRINALPAAFCAEHTAPVLRIIEIGKNNPDKDFAEAQLSNYRQRKKSLEQSSQVLTQRLNIAQEVLHINEKLVAAGDTSQMEVLQSQREVAQLKGELIDINSTYYLQAQDDAVRLQTELASTTHQLEERRSVLSHTELTSPVTGVVKYLKVNTLGGVFRAGDELMQISPTDDEMFIEIKVNPAAMAENPRFAEIVLKPGMTVNASIRTGTRTVLRYLLKPIYRGFQGALSER